MASDWIYIAQMVYWTCIVCSLTHLAESAINNPLHQVSWRTLSETCFLWHRQFSVGSVHVVWHSDPWDQCKFESWIPNSLLSCCSLILLVPSDVQWLPLFHSLELLMNFTFQRKEYFPGRHPKPLNNSAYCSFLKMSFAGELLWFLTCSALLMVFIHLTKSSLRHVSAPKILWE